MKPTMKMQNVMVAIPTHSGKVEVECLASIFALQGRLLSTRPHIGMSMSSVTGVPIDYARNLLAAQFMANKSATHLLFVDDDMGFRPSLIEKLIDEDKPVVAAFCPSRQFDHKAAYSQHQIDPQKRMSVSATYIGTDKIVQQDGMFNVTKTGFVRVSAIGTGVMLIHREVFEKIGSDGLLWTRPDDRRYKKHFAHPVLEAFKPIVDEKGDYLSEDLSFCRRWSDSGGEIWACVDEEIVHVGRMAVRGTMLDQMQHFSKVNAAIMPHQENLELTQAPTSVM